MAHVLPDSIHRRLGYLLAKAHQRQLMLFEQHMAALEVSGRDYAALLALEANENLWQSDIAQLLGVDRTTVTYMIDRLEKRGWLSRQRDPADRRAYVIGLTAEGRDALTTIHPAARSATDELLAGLDDNERTQLRDLLARLVAS